jgi:RNase P/RNase MRP subunit p29
MEIKELIGRKIKVVNSEHPHYNETGIIIGHEHTIVGQGLKIKNSNSDLSDFFVFSGGDIYLYPKEV